jgi:hypothetical protein
MLGRRSFLTLGGAATVLAALPMKVASANPLVALAITQLATAAGEYIGRGLLENALGSASNAPTNADVIAAIQTSTDEIKKHVSVEVRAAITEDNLIKLQASFSANYSMLRSYAVASPTNRNDYRHRLEAADVSSQKDVEVAKGLGTAGLPLLASLVSLRIIVARAFYDMNGYRNVYRDFGIELHGHKTALRNGVIAFIQSLAPGVRLHDFQCRPSGTEGQFPIRMYTCYYVLDGVLTQAAEGSSSPGSRFDEAITQKALNEGKLPKERELADYQLKMIKEFGDPLIAIGEKWQKVVNEINPGPPYTTTTSGISVIPTANPSSR